MNFEQPLLQIRQRLLFLPAPRIQRNLEATKERGKNFLVSILLCSDAMPAPPSSMSLLSRCYRCCSSSSSSSPAPAPKQQAADSKHIRGARLLLTRRAHAFSLLAGAAAAATLPVAGRARAEEEGEGVVGAIKSLFDPNEETKAGKVLPKAYLKAAREVVRTLRESLEEDAAGDSAKFRRGADSAKVSIREFLGGWRGQQAVAKEESYVALEKAIRSLAEFYSKAGPFGSLPGDVKTKILDDLNTAEANL